MQEKNETRSEVNPTNSSGAEGQRRPGGLLTSTIPLDGFGAEHPAWPPAQSNRPKAWQILTLLILPVVISASAAFAVASQRQPVYVARSEIILDVRNLGGESADRLLGTELAVAESRAVLAPTAEKFGVPAGALEGRLSAELIQNSSIVRLQYQDPVPSRALDIIAATTERYLSVLQEFASQEDIRPRVLTPPFLVEEPVSPNPLRAAAVGAAVGMALAAIGIILWVRPWRTDHQA